MNEKEFYEKAQKEFAYFIAYIAPWYQFAHHHREIVKQLQRLIDGEILKLAISVPPRGGKSQLCSRFLPAFILGRQRSRGDSIILGSYGQKLSNGFGKDVIDIMRLPAYKKLFPEVELTSKGTSGENIKTSEGGDFFATSVKGAGTGMDMHWGIADDTLKGLAEASSPAVIKTVHEWYVGTLLARSTVNQYGEPARMLILSTRWADNDLIGYVTENEPEEWVYLNYSALAMEDDPLDREVGESIWKERYPEEFYEKIRKLDPVTFSKVYQGVPTSDEGNYFNVKNLTYYERGQHPTAKGVYFMSLDTASETHSNADYSVITVWFQDKDSNIWLIDAIKERLDILGLYAKTVEVFRQYRPKFTCIEKASSGIALLQMLNSQNPEIKTIQIKANLEDAAMQAKPILETPKVKMLPDTDIVYELAAYPTGKHDDVVASISNFLSWWGNSKNIGLTEVLDLESRPERKFVTKKKRGMRVSAFGEVRSKQPRHSQWRSL